MTTFTNWNRSLRLAIRGRAGAADLLWIFGFGRTGSTWLAKMLGGGDRRALWPEPRIGLLAAGPVFPKPFMGDVDLIERYDDSQRASPSFILGGPPEHWVPAIRAFVTAAVRARYPSLRRGDVLVINEQNGSVGAQMLSQALPESRVLVLVRDPRDVMASVRDALRPGSWAATQLGTSGDTEVFDAGAWSEYFAESMGAALAAYETHVGPRAIVTYEALRADTPAALRCLSRELRLEANETWIARTVAENSWATIPADHKGRGRFYRRAEPGRWRAELSAEEVELIEQNTSSIIRRFYP